MHHVSVDPHDLIDIVNRFPPGDARPTLAMPRHWSNTRLQDPDTIIALVLGRPTTEDLARTIVAYGPERVLGMLDRLADEGELAPEQTKHVGEWLGPIMRGVADAARELPSG